MTAAAPAVYYAMARPLLRLQPARFEVGTLEVTERLGILPAPKPDILMQGAIGALPGVPVVVIEGMGKHLVRIIERDGTRRLVVDDGTTWHCEGEAVGVYEYGICSPGKPIHYSPCGWRPGDGWRSITRAGS